MDKKSISVIIPAYNAENYIQRCLSSVCEQDSSSQIEIIVVNDGSTDSTRLIIEDCIKNTDVLIKLINIDNGGLANARNVGWKEANGEYFINLDADDYLEPGIISSLLRKIEDENFDCCFYGYQSVDESSHKIRNRYDERFHYLDSPISGHDAFIKRASKYLWICQGSACYKKDIVSHYKITNHKGVNQGEDFLFIMSFLAVASIVTSINQIGVNISYRSESMMHTKYNVSHLEVFNALDFLYAFLRKTFPDRNIDDLIDWVDVEYEIERLSMCKRIVRANPTESNEKIIEIAKRDIPKKRKCKYKLLDGTKKVESMLFNHFEKLYIQAVRFYDR